MTDEIKKEFFEVLRSVGPVSIVVFLFLFFISKGEILNFTIGFIMVILGITLFLLGINLGFLPFGEAIGSELPMRGSLSFLLIFSFIIGFITTIAEPDVRVLSTQIDYVSNGAIPQFLLVLSISFGIGIFVSLAMLRIIYGIGFPYLFIGGYVIIILLSLFTPQSFVAIAFDAGGVTTGPVTVPIILSLGIGISSVLGGKSALSDGFGLIGLASMGPVISVMLLGVLYS
ncbi:MAG: hypothetical protein APG12_00851 [Candidatus Methanofastidiosum methylothiophilum]|uniref:DUF1538 domain-containing protein n=1 Tax=Candidatus Methanofastidiosum methylothiophilum TaxID=1705564 RepID=A0A150IHL0_9EURY|nr:MAG: hypothetical protein APG10_01735 [Candidatus Methanofastidiosum methylthiophilus]KYC47522.1 MAG: hypothetical protein APG11_01123 [Candidatus Methanofastidiosum methylthiophilus]KYC50422.1 MAG: hypothetical protein APG12_00851 [Candidatus Methanofastidiosum methylthiophilus]